VWDWVGVVWFDAEERERERASVEVRKEEEVEVEVAEGGRSRQIELSFASFTLHRFPNCSFERQCT